MTFHGSLSLVRIAEIILFVILLPVAALLMRRVHQLFGWRSFSKLARLDISLELYHHLCRLHAALAWCWLSLTIHLVATIARLALPSTDSIATRAIVLASLLPVLIGAAWALSIGAYKPTRVMSRLIQVRSSAQPWPFMTFHDLP